MKTDFTQWLTTLPQAASERYPLGTPFVEALRHGSMSVELYAPACAGLGRDIQQPHAQDELYIVQRGTSDFWLDGKTLKTAAGDVLFVPAGVPHRFEDFSNDFLTWVVFYGPNGGEHT